MPGKSTLKWKNSSGDHCSCLWEIGAHSIAPSSKKKNNRNVWFVFLNRAKNVVFKSFIIFINRSTIAWKKPSQRKKWLWQSLLSCFRNGSHFFTYSSQTNNDRSLWLVLLNRATNAVFESVIDFKIDPHIPKKVHNSWKRTEVITTTIFPFEKAFL